MYSVVLLMKLQKGDTVCDVQCLVPSFTPDDMAHITHELCFRLNLGQFYHLLYITHYVSSKRNILTAVQIHQRKLCDCAS